MSQRPAHILALPAERAFVVQFRAKIAVELGSALGRVEHVVSGQATHFHTLVVGRPRRRYGITSRLTSMGGPFRCPGV